MATELILRPDPKILHLVPVTPHDQELIDGLRADRSYRGKLTLANERSLKQNRYYWGGLLTTVVENHPYYVRTEPLHLWLKTRMGYVNKITFHDGSIQNEVDSTAFDKMAPDEFKTFLDAAILILCNEVIPGMDRRAFLRTVEGKVHITYDELFEPKAAA